jgi:hypothetical protein
MAKMAVLAVVIQDEADGLAFGVPVGRGDDLGSVGLWPGLFGEGEALPGPLVEFCQHQVGPVELVAGGAEVLADRPEMDAAAGAVIHEPGGLGVVRIVAEARVDAQLGLKRLADRSGLDEVDQALGEDGCLRPGGQPDGQPPGVTWPTPACAAVGSMALSSCACLAGQSAASRSGWPSACSCWRLVSLGGWDAAATASGSVRPSSDAQPWTSRQSRWPSPRSSSPVTGHRVADVIVRPVTLGETARSNAELDARSRCLRLQSGGRVDREASCPSRVQETLVIGHEGG